MPTNPRVVICVHGLGRNGRDFDVLGEALAPTHRVLAVDMPGRGTVGLARRSERLCLPDLPDHADRADRPQRRGRCRLGRHVDGRLARDRHGRAAEHADPPPGRQRRRTADRARRAGAHRQLLRAGSDVRHVSLRSKPTSAADFGAVRAADRRAMGAHDANQRRASAPTGAGAWPTIPASPCRFATRRRRRTCGRCGTRSSVRCWCCAARNPTCCRADVAAQMAARGPKPRVIEFAGVGHAPMLLDRGPVRSGGRFPARERLMPSARCGNAGTRSA